MAKRIILTVLVTALLHFNGLAQVKQTIRGVVTDKQSEIPIPGANVVIEGTSPLLGATTNARGIYIIENVPIGKHTITATSIGYEKSTQKNVRVGAGKQAEVNFHLTETTFNLDEVVVKSGNSITNETNNSMSFISGRSFSVEETRRYAGGMDDPARLVSAFAGVTTGNLQDNAIIVRGNSPKYVGWYLEGVEIPNPNHFSNINVIGGGFVTIFSNQLLANSDFFTGAFASEYSNALSGIFDMRLRTGNTQKREYTFQAGLIGIDFAFEGPFVKGKNASYLINYRYSTMSLVAPLIPGTQVPKYQDLSFKLNFPTKKAGTFSLWGIGALDENVQSENTDSTEWVKDFDRFAYKYKQNTGATGISHRKIFGAQTFMFSTLVASANQSIMDMKRFNDDLVLQDNWYGDNMEGKYTFKTYLNHKFGKRHTNRTGFIYNNLFYKLKNEAAIQDTLPTITLSDEKGSTNSIEAFSQSQVSIFPGTKLNIGIHATYFQLNDEFLIEPRVGISQMINNSHKLSLGYGLHSGMEPLRIYFYQYNNNGEPIYPNKNLKLTKAHHLIGAYDWAINQSMRLKVEPYFQYLFDVPVIKDSVFSMLNFEQDFHFNDQLVNEGKGMNYGIDITFEKFFDNSYYYLLTTSFFKSNYETSNGEVYPTRYDKGFVVNLLAGKEFSWQRQYRNTFSINGRLTISGGQKVTPLNRELSEAARAVHYDWAQPYANQNPTDYYCDLTVSWRKDKKRTASVLSVQVKNILGNPTEYNWTYNYQQQKLEKQSVVVVVPNISYRIEF